MSFIKEFDHLKIPLEEIILATDNFNRNQLIGHGGFGPVYKGELSLPEGPVVVAFKRLDRNLGQGNNEFWKEIMMLSKYKHENLVTLLRFCIEGDERVLVYEYVSRGSLDRHLSDSSLTWTQRLKICIGVASALNYLHDPMEKHHRVLHRDVKSSNILLDENWCAKVSDFGLSKVGPANQSQTYLLSNVVGTPGYCDPLYWETGFLSKESDVYSFGVVLLEVMCGKLCCEYSEGKLIRILVNMWKECCEKGRLETIMIDCMKEEMDRDSLTVFSAIANRCLSRESKERPTMVEIIKELEVALEKQHFYQGSWSLVELGKLAEPHLAYESQEKLLILLSNGFRYKDTTWVSLDKNQGVCEMISAAKCIANDRKSAFRVVREESSRFDDVIKDGCDFKIEVKPEFLRPRVTYTINLVYKLKQWDHGTCIPFKYKLEEEAHYSGPFVAESREDGWFASQLYRFTCYKREQCFSINCLHLSSLKCHAIQGIEFRPIEYETKERNEVDIPSMDTNWEDKFPNDYINLLHLSNDTIQWTTKKEAYLSLRQGFFIDNHDKWFSITKRMKKRVMIPVEAFLFDYDWTWKSLQESRFGVVAESQVKKSFSAKCKIKSQSFSPQTTYTCHLIYKLPDNYTLLESIVEVQNLRWGKSFSSLWYIYLASPCTPIMVPDADGTSHIPSYTHKIKGHPKLRKDGWMECQFWEATTTSNGTINLYLDFRNVIVNRQIFVGLMVQGLEFRQV